MCCSTPLRVAARPLVMISPPVVYVLTHGIDIGSAIAVGLVARGSRVAWLSDVAEAPLVELDASVLPIAASFESRAGLERAFGLAQQRLGAPTQVVISAIPRVALQARDIVALSDDDWRAACGQAMKSVLHALQASHTAMAGGGGSVVVVGPSLSLAGAARLVPLSTPAEGQRGLVKPTARQ